MRKIHVFQSFSTVYLIRQMFADQQIIIYEKKSYFEYDIRSVQESS